MATDNGRINAAINSVKAIDYDGPVRGDALAVLEKLKCAEGQWRRKNAQRLDELVNQLADQKRLRTGKNLGFLRCAADYQDAPLGTVISKRFGSGWWKKVHDAWIDENGTVMPGAHIATAPREVRKWGDL